MRRVICKLCVPVLFSFLIITTASVHAETSEVTDTRTEIQLSKSERDFVLLEMRTFLQSAQQIISGINNDDMQKVVEAARKSGRAATKAMPGSLPAKLPPAFKKLGGDTHKRFDELALNAEQLGDGDHALSQLGVLMENCVACHDIFRFELE